MLAESDLTTDPAEVPESAADIKITVTLGGSRSHKVWTEQQSGPFRSFYDDLFTTASVGPKEGTCYTPATFSGRKRAKDQSTCIGIAVLDSDSGHTEAELLAAVKNKGWGAIIHSTHSHLTAKTKVSKKALDDWREANGDDVERYMREKKGYLPRVISGAKIVDEQEGNYIVAHQPCEKYRVIIPLATPWMAPGAAGADQTAANVRWANRILALAYALGMWADESCTDTSRLFFLPRIERADAPYIHHFIEGAPCDIWSLSSAPDVESTEDPASKPRTRAEHREAPRERHAHHHAPAGAVDLQQAKDKAGATKDLIAWAANEGKRFEIARALAFRGVAFYRGAGTAKPHIVCPYDEYHTKEGDQGSTYVVNASDRTAAGMPSITSGFIVHCSHNACTGRDRLAFVAGLLALGRLYVEDLTNPVFLMPAEDGPAPLPPQRPEKLYSVQKARKTIADTFTAFQAATERSWAAREAGRILPRAPLLLLTPTPGTGKTKGAIAALANLIPLARVAGKRIWFFVKSRDAIDERMYEFNEVHEGKGFKAAGFRGRGAPDRDVELPDGGFPSLCRRYPVAEALGEAELSVGSNICKGCFHDGHAVPVKRCGYIPQIDRDTDVIFTAFNYAFLPGALKNLGEVEPYAVFFDEDAAGAALDKRVIGLREVDRNLPADPVEGMKRDLGQPWDKSAAEAVLEPLASILRQIANTTPYGQTATAPTAPIIAAGITAEMAKQAAWVLDTSSGIKVDLPQTTEQDDRDPEIINIARESAAAIARRKSQHRLALMVQAALEAGHDRVPALEVERYWYEGKPLMRATMAWRKPLTEALVDCPIMYLDATADPMIVEAMFGRIPVHTHVEVDMPNAKVYHVNWSASARKLHPEKGASQNDKNAAVGHRREVYELTRKLASVYGSRGTIRSGKRHDPRYLNGKPIGEIEWAPTRRKNILEVVSIALSELMEKEFVDPPCVEIRAHGKLAGSNNYEDFYCIIDLSGSRPLPSELEMQAEALHGCPVQRLGLDKDGNAKWPDKVPAMLRMRDQEVGPVIKTPRHPDARVEAFRWRAYEGEKFQNIHRLRPVNRPQHDPVIIVTIGDAVLPLEIDEYIPDRKDALPDDTYMLRKLHGIVPLDGVKGRTKIIHNLRRDRAPDQWGSEEYAKKFLQNNPQSESAADAAVPIFSIKVEGARTAVPCRVYLSALPDMGEVETVTVEDAIRGIKERCAEYGLTVEASLDEASLPHAARAAMAYLDSLTLPEPTPEEKAEFARAFLDYGMLCDLTGLALYEEPA